MLKPFYLLLATALIGCSPQSKKGEDVKYNPPSSFQPRAHQEYDLPNGLKVILVQDDSLPYISYSLLLKTGAVDDPSGKAGLSSFTAAILEKGTKEKSAAVIADKLGRMAADFDATVHPDFTLFKVSSLSSFQSELLSLFSEIVKEPSFPDAEVTRLRKQYLSQLTKLADNPSSFADRAFDTYLFQESPYGQPTSGTLASIKGMTRQDLQGHFSRYYRPNQAILAVVGKYNDQLRSQIEAYFKNWERGEVNTHNYPAPEAPTDVRLRVVNKPEMVQTQLRFGHIGIPRSHPDFLQIRVANTILGNGFASRLMSRVRDQLGLTYHISSGLDTFQTTGGFEIKTFTQNARVGQTVKETLNTYKEFYDRGVTEAEVKDAKSFLIGQFPQAVETAEAWAFNLMVLRVYGIPDSYLTDYTKSIAAITTAQVNDVIKKNFHPDKIKVLAYSTAPNIVDQLKAFGSVEVREYKDFQ